MPELLAQVPKGDQTRAFFLKIAKENPEILTYVPEDFKKNASFMYKAIKENSNSAKYLQGVTEDTVLAILNLNKEWFSRDTVKDQAILNAVPEMTSDRDFLLKAAKFGCDVTPYLAQHSDDKNLILEIMRLFRTKTIRIGSPQAENIQPDLSYTIKAFKAASEDLKKIVILLKKP
ncbi:MAG: DUF4116 domain-containing protein [Parachlamydiaceae bacterium]|nr:MAG: DUF4116 domain-containing protein [Parachlamydiaceae bacterium]